MCIRDRAGGQQIGADTIASLTGCGETQIVETIWPDVTPDNYDVYVSVDPDGAVQETSESNNSASTQVNLATNQVLLPLVNR